MGGVAAHTPLHSDIDSNNLDAVVYGKKSSLLYRPEDTPFLYPSEVYEWATVFSSVDFRDPDVDRHPDILNARAFEGTLEVGDVLFLPIGWWHKVRCLEPTISLNAWLLEWRLFGSRKLYRDIARMALHRMGLYARDRCTCHGHGDLSIHHGW